MTAICAGGGTSSAKAGFDPTVYASAAVLGNLLLNKASPKAAAFAAYLAAKTYDLVTFCNTDPPTLVVPSALQFAEFLNVFDPVLQSPAAVAVQNWVDYYAWFMFCKCDAGAQPTQTAVALPSGTPQLAPPVPPQLVGPCATDTIALTQTNGQVPPSPTASDQTIAFAPAPAGLNVTWVRDTITYGPIGVGADLFVQIQVKNINGSIIQQINHAIVDADPMPYVLQGAVPIGAWTLTVESLMQGIAGSITTSNQIDLFCNGELPTSTVTPCCPPDPGIVSMLSQIQQMVTLIQRQASPFSYVYGTNHPGLSGNGSFAVSGLIGVSVAPTTIPSSYGLEVGSPDEHFGLGFITLGTADGWTSSRALDHDGTLMIPPSAGLFTSIGYTLAPGVVADIRELVREP